MKLRDVGRLQVGAVIQHANGKMKIIGHINQASGVCNDHHGR